MVIIYFKGKCALNNIYRVTLSFSLLSLDGGEGGGGGGGGGGVGAGSRLSL